MGNPEWTLLEKPNQLGAPQRGTQIPTPENPIYHSGPAALGTLADHFQSLGGGPFSRFTKGAHSPGAGATAASG